MRIPRPGYARRGLAMRRASAAAVVVLASASVWASASAAPSTTSSGPVVAPLLVRDSIEIDGVGCGVPVSASTALPAGVIGVHVQRPKVGARDHDVRITKVVVRQGAVTFTAVADGDLVCDPDRD